MKKIMLAAAIITLVTGCASTEGDAGEATTGSNRPASATPAEEAPSEEPAEPVDENLAFGDTFTYKDGLSVTVSAPKPFTPSESACCIKAGSGQKALLFTVTLVNGTSANFDPGAFSTTVQSKNVEAESIFDTDIMGAPSTTLLPGREASFKIAYAVADPADLVLEVSPDFFEHKTYIVTNAA